MIQMKTENEMKTMGGNPCGKPVETDTDGTYCGLMDRRGNCVTKPLYRQIDAIARDRYLTWPQGVILDSNGSVVDCYDLPGGSDGH